MKLRQRLSSEHRLLVTLLLVAILLRLGLFFVYQPVPYGDTPSYRRLAEAVLRGFERYDGTRTPGYPIFLALAGPDERVWLIQMALGILITLLLYYTGWKLTGKGWFGFVVALAHTLNLGQLFFEANLLTETLTTFWVMLTLAGYLYGLQNPKGPSVWLAAGLGLTSSLALITRPLFLYLPIWILLFVVFARKQSPSGENEHVQPPASARPFVKIHIHWPQAVAFILPVILIAGGWVAFIHTHYGDWGLTTMTGYHLVQHTGSFFEYVPDRYAALRDTYLVYRDAQIAQHGTQTNAIWEAIPEMQAASGLNFYDLSRTLARISIRLIIAHPDKYLRNVLEGWWLFWRAPVYWSADALRHQGLAPVLSSLIQAERLVLAGVNVIFILSSLVGVFISRRWPVSGERRAFLWCLLGTIWIASILQTLLDHGDNPRFLVPLQSLVVLWVIWVAAALFHNKPWRISARGEPGSQ